MKHIIDREEKTQLSVKEKINLKGLSDFLLGKLWWVWRGEGDGVQKEIDGPVKGQRVTSCSRGFPNGNKGRVKVTVKRETG